jgi:hypothetical protein
MSEENETEEKKWFVYDDAFPIDEFTKQDWIRQLRRPDRLEHMRADFITSGDTLILALHSGEDLEIWELQPVRHAYLRGEGRDTRESRYSVYKKKEG